MEEVLIFITPEILPTRELVSSPDVAAAPQAGMPVPATPSGGRR